MKSSGCPDRLSPTWVVIPTYWGDAGEGIYDHPTPLGGQSTLPRLLDSFVKQSDATEYCVLILVSSTSPKLDGEAAVFVRMLLSPYAKVLNLFVTDAPAARCLGKMISAYSHNINLSSMRGYAAVRNIQLLVPMALGAEVIIAVDDDEVLPESYLQQAMKWIGKSQNGQHITGIGGPYLDASGNVYMAQADQVRNILVDKSVFMNATLRKVMVDADVLHKTPMAFGGNMIFHRDLFSQVGFDPAITRGEDIDYVINARIAGQAFHFDPNLTIIHLPPRHFEAPQYARMCQDVIRFIYEREKIRQYGLPAADLLPYPGSLLGDDFVAAALDALQACATAEMTAKFGRPEEVLKEAQAHAREAAPEYAEFAAQWKKAGAILESKTEAGELLSLIRL